MKKSELTDEIIKTEQSGSLGFKLRIVPEQFDLATEGSPGPHTTRNLIWLYIPLPPQPMQDNPNFPLNLEINPSEETFSHPDIFGASAQKSAIKEYGIAGRVW